MTEEKKETDIIKFETASGEVKLSPALVKAYLVSGDATKVTDQEVVMFLQLCKFQKLNPWLKEAYLIKYGSNNPATIVTGKEAFLKRAVANLKYQGHEVSYNDEANTATAKVYVQGYTVPIEVTVDFDEYAGKKADGTLNKTWAGKKKTMLKKCALVQALREAFPNDLGGMYTEDEMHKVGSDDIKQDVPIPAAKSNVVTNEDEEHEEHHEKETYDVPVISDAQGKRFYAIAKGSGKTDDEIHIWLDFNYNLKSSRDIPRSLYQEICEKIAIKHNV